MKNSTSNIDEGANEIGDAYYQHPAVGGAETGFGDPIAAKIIDICIEYIFYTASYITYTLPIQAQMNSDNLCGI